MTEDHTRSFQSRVKSAIKRIPKGRVATYGQIAAIAGNPRAARQVVRALHASSEKEKLPWHRVINREGKISLKPGQGHELQRELLSKEGIKFDLSGAVEMSKFLWQPAQSRRNPSAR